MQALLLPEPVCRLLVARGYGDVEAAKRFLRPRLEHLSAPDTLRDLPRAVERIADAVRAQETIFVHGDYDVDGMSSTALMVRVLRGLGAAHVVPFVPNRLTDGYDLGRAGVEAAQRAGATLVVTCDCGTSARDAVTTLNASGIDVIITDHHLPSHALPASYAICNPRHPECPSVDKDLAAVGVAYKIALALCDAFNVSPVLAHRQLDLVALATIADVAPLRGENRVMVRYGLKLLAETTHPGLRALIRSSGLEGKPLTAGRVGFVLAPRLNAAGRIADAKLGLQLLLAERDDEANVIARELEELNRARQELDRAVLDDAMRQVDAPGMGDRYAYVLSREGWHAGVIGIVASRIVEQTARPAVLVAVQDGIGKGSGRSISAFDLHGALGDCAMHVQRFGGHRAAAGLTMPIIPPLGNWWPMAPPGSVLQPNSRNVLQPGSRMPGGSLSMPGSASVPMPMPHAPVPNTTPFGIHPGGGGGRGSGDGANMGLGGMEGNAEPPPHLQQRTSGVVSCHA